VRRAGVKTPQGSADRLHRPEGWVTRSNEEIIKEVVQMVRDRIGPVASFKTATVVKRLPKTAPAKSCAARSRRSPTTRSEDAGTIDDRCVSMRSSRRSTLSAMRRGGRPDKNGSTVHGSAVKERTKG